jgi:hypothetical protein
MWHNFVNKDPTLIVITSGNQSSSEYLLFPELKQNLGGHNFKDNRELETAVTRWLVTEETDLYQQEIKKHVHDGINTPDATRSMLKISGITMQLKPNCFLYLKIKNPKYTKRKLIF